MRAFYTVSLLRIEIIQLRLSMLKYEFLIGFYSALADDRNHLDQKKSEFS